MVAGIGYELNWDGTKYFVGLCFSQHTMASLCCLIVSLILFISKTENKFCILHCIMLCIPTYAILESGARVFLIPILICWYLFFHFAIKSKLYRRILYVACIVLSFFVLLNTSMINKFIYALGNSQSNNLISSFTSGRSEFWKYDIEYYFSANCLEWFLGTSFSDVYAVNMQTLNLDIWAHNDIIHLLIGGGIVGVICYSFLIFRLFNSMREYRIGGIVYISMILYLVIPMLLNGFFIYQHFVYSFIILYFVTIQFSKK